MIADWAMFRSRIGIGRRMNITSKSKPPRPLAAAAAAAAAAARDSGIAA